MKNSLRKLIQHRFCPLEKNRKLQFETASTVHQRGVLAVFQIFEGILAVRLTDGSDDPDQTNESEIEVHLLVDKKT